MPAIVRVSSLMMRAWIRFCESRVANVRLVEVVGLSAVDVDACAGDQVGLS